MLRATTHAGWIKQQQIRRQSRGNPTATVKSKRSRTVAREPSDRLGEPQHAKITRPVTEQMQSEPGVIEKRQVGTRVRQ
jgi:hypothetical protein